MTTEQGRCARVLTAIGFPLLVLVAWSAWALASPAGSSPDDDFHLASIWCGIGEREGLCEAADDPTARLVPAPIAAPPCFAREARVSGACTRDAPSGLAEAPWLNVEGVYPRLYYAAMAPLATQHVDASVVAIRVVNAAIAVALLTAAFWALPRGMRPALVVPVVVTLVPFGLFLVPSTNPSSWAYLSAALVWVCVLGALRTGGGRRGMLLTLAVVATALGAGARADAALFAVFGAGLAWLLAGGTVRRPRAPSAVSVVLAVVAGSLFLTAGQAGAATGGLFNDAPPLSVDQHVSNLQLIPPVIWGGAFGWGPLGKLGWLETPVPTTATALAVAALILVVTAAPPLLKGRRRWVLLLAVAAAWLMPFVLLAQSHAEVGLVVQSRYVLPLLVIAVGVPVLDVPIATWSAARGWASGAAVTVAGSLALHATLRRYTVGADGWALDPGRNATWWWDTTTSPLTVWTIGSLALAGVIACLVGFARAGSAVPDGSGETGVEAARARLR